jgi:hypothetical protein
MSLNILYYYVNFYDNIFKLVEMWFFTFEISRKSLTSVCWWIFEENLRYIEVKWSEYKERSLAAISDICWFFVTFNKFFVYIWYKHKRFLIYTPSKSVMFVTKSYKIEKKSYLSFFGIFVSLFYTFSGFLFINFLLSLQEIPYIVARKFHCTS